MDAMTWNPDSWRSRTFHQRPPYEDEAAVEAVERELRCLPPLVTSWEIESLRELLAEAQEGRRFVLQGGDCAEVIEECQSPIITNKLKILLQMSLVLVHGLQKPAIRIGRFAGQYAKPRSSPNETREIDGKELTLPSYFGDLVNRAAFDPTSRKPDPHHMVKGYLHAGMTLNFVRALVDGGFADLHHPEQWDLGFTDHHGLSEELRSEYRRMSRNLADGLRLMEALGEAQIEDLTRTDFFTSHEGLNLYYESAQTRRVPRREGHYLLNTHMPWIGERTRQLDGAHVEFFRGTRNPIGVKIGPTTTPDELARLTDRLDPHEEPGRMVLITRMGEERVSEALPPLLEALRGRRVLWMADPMHGNTRTTPAGVKTRSFDAILKDLESTIDAHAAAGTILGGVHFELTGEDVTECTGGAAGLTDEELSGNYASLCDPRLNYQQSLELAFLLARRLSNGRD